MGDEFFHDLLCGGPSVLHCRSLLHATIAHAFTTRQTLLGGRALSVGGCTGETEAEENLIALAGVLGVDRRRFFRPTQVHGKTVLTVDQTSDTAQVRRQEADALVTATPGVFVAVATADCVPVLLADPEAGVVAAAHAGWRGILAGVLEATVQTMCHQGAAAARICAAVGPAIGVEAFNVGEETAEKFSGLPAVVERRGATRRAHIDLGRAAEALLTGEGVRPQNIARSRFCTYAAEEHFFSYRREGAAAGRQLAFIGRQA